MARKTRRKFKGIDNFTEEVGTLGEKFGKDMEKRQWDSWFHRTLGVVGPLISSIFGLIIFAFVIWILGFMTAQIGSTILSLIHNFLLANIGLFFLIFLFFSYTSYFSKAYTKAYTPFSPIVTAVSFVIGIWILVRAINVSNFYLGISSLPNMMLYIEANYFWIFSFVLLLGYLVLSIRIFQKPIKIEKGVVMRKSKIHRLYRSGNDKILGGVCGGVAEYLGVDPVIIRLLWVIGSFLWGFGVLLYIIAWIIIPRNPNHKWS